MACSEKTFKPPFPDRTLIEITIDGPKRIHDTIRVNCRKEPTYELIIRNIYIATSHNMPVILRINANSGSEMEEALDDLDQRGVRTMNQISFYDGQVDNSFKELVYGRRCRGNCETQKHMDVLVDIRSVIAKKGWMAKYQQFPLFVAKRGVCKFARPGNYCIGPDCNIYLCFFHVGEEKHCVGVINEDGTPKFYDTYQQIMQKTPFDNEKCSNCAYLPQCWGGCFSKAFEKHGSYKAAYCDNIQEMFPILLQPIS